MRTDKSYIRRASEKINYLLRFREDFRRTSQFNEGYYTFYAATNENLEYFADLGVADKDALTVTSSGDQALNLAYFGAKSIDTFDINELAIIAFDLKKTALLHLSRSEFIDFYTTSSFLDKKLYRKIYPYLSDVTKVVFGAIFKAVNQDESREEQAKSNSANPLFKKADADVGFKRVVEEFDKIDENLVKNNPYLSSDQAYLETRRRIMSMEAINHKVCPAHKLSEFFGPKDIIILSNVRKYYMHSMYLMNNEFNFSNPSRVKDFVKSIRDTLTDDGIASLLYMGRLNGGHDDEQKLRTYLNVEGNVKYLQEEMTPRFDLRYDLVFLAEKEDFPEFEK